jgi:hypothetical protein
VVQPAKRLANSTISRRGIARVCVHGLCAALIRRLRAAFACDSPFGIVRYSVPRFAAAVTRINNSRSFLMGTYRNRL